MIRQQETLNTYVETFPVRTPGKIQPHGCLIAVHPKTFVIECVSQNIASFLGKKDDVLLGKSLDILLSESQILELKVALNKQSNIPQLHHFTIEVEGCSKYFYRLVYQTEQAIILELEPTESEAKPNVIFFQSLLEDTLTEMQRVTYLQELLSLFTERVRELTGFDRVMVYRFAQDGTGIVEAESRADYMASYLGLHFPALDIPESARELFQLNALRLISEY